MLHPRTAKTFQEYADTVFTSYISSQLKNVERLDIVWDVYIADSLKQSTRQKRGKGVRRRVASNTAIPQNWEGLPSCRRQQVRAVQIFVTAYHEQSSS